MAAATTVGAGETRGLRGLLPLPFVVRAALLPWWVTLVPAGVAVAQGRPLLALLLGAAGIAVSTLAVLGVLLISALRTDS